MEKRKASSGWTHKSQGCRYVTVCGKSMLEHRFIMEEHLGRLLQANEVVHHINGNRMDNRIENLQVMTRGQHTSLHNTGKSRKGNVVPPRNEEQRAKYRDAALKRGRPSEETKRKIADSVSKARSERFWSTRKRA